MDNNTVPHYATVLHIYGLRDPVSGSIRYVGSADDPRHRMSGHWRERLRTKSDKADWLRSLDRQGLAPELVILDTSSAVERLEAERYWIDKLLAAGHPLLNVVYGPAKPQLPPTVPAAMDDPDELVNASEAARIKGVSRQAVTQALRSGRLTGQRWGRYWLVRRSDLLGWSPLAGYPKGKPRGPNKEKPNE